MKHRTKVIISTSLILIAAIVVAYAGTWALTKYFDNQYVSLNDGCQPNQKNYEIVIKDEIASPANVIAARCETLTITNLDSADRLMAFGVHDKHLAYNGVTEKMISKGQSFTVVLVQTGDFLVHDHDDEDVGATFTVK